MTVFLQWRCYVKTRLNLGNPKPIKNTLRNIKNNIYKKTIFRRRKTLIKSREQERETMTPFVVNAADMYQQSIVALAKAEEKPSAKVYRSLNTMLEECYLVGASRFGHNFIA